ncbi:Retrovirus-related Pol polyprotein from transposon TNT 1-94 [Gossypium australe]|uniref:Retrovirus-related Pol polyprotein from transposon TNT 1-94 n=1 Tax=Gossypium australe TaxID=47621 RepID=A0A5B6W745_9ROSI|nr:Retrovirus-related Pol polyprotein from transposon TNT 1-94 [Gossypium australe]
MSKSIWDSLKQKYQEMAKIFNYVVCAIKESNDIDTLTINQLQSSLLVHKQHMTSPVTKEQALKVTHEGKPGRARGRGCGSFCGRGRSSSSFHKSIMECYHCHKLGHYQ